MISHSRLLIIFFTICFSIFFLTRRSLNAEHYLENKKLSYSFKLISSSALPTDIETEEITILPTIQTSEAPIGGSEDSTLDNEDSTYASDSPTYESGDPTHESEDPTLASDSPTHESITHPPTRHAVTLFPKMSVPKDTSLSKSNTLSKLLNTLVNEAINSHAIHPSSFVGSALQKVFPTTESTKDTPTNLKFVFTEQPPEVSHPRDLIPYYRKRYIAFRRISLALTKEWRMYNIRMHNYRVKIKKGLPASLPPSPKPTPRPPPITEKADFNGMDPPSAAFQIDIPPWKAGEIIRMRYFKGNKEVSQEEVMYEGIEHPEEFSFALVSVTTYSRMFFITHLLRRWKGPISIVVYGMKDMEETIMHYFSTHRYEDRLTTIFYIVDNLSDESIDFPINKLRNIGIRSSHTTHYLVIDMDVWPAMDLYDSFKELSSEKLKDETIAIILPLIFFDLGTMLAQCRELSSCIKLALELFPRNKYEVDACVRTRVCMYHKANLFTHAYTNNIWVNWQRSIIAELKCVANDYQEPYVLLKRSNNTPLFDERFKNYGYNKVQLIEHLKYKGFHFHVLMSSFAMDMPHRGSTFKAQFMKQMNTTSSMDTLYLHFQEELKEMYSSSYMIPTCKSIKNVNIYTFFVCS